MKRPGTKRIVLIAMLSLAAAATVYAAGVDGNVRLGYTHTDEKGNYGVYQPTFNLYEGVAVSLEDFQHEFSSGLQIRSNLQNITLNNRRANAGIGIRNLFGVDFSGVQYRRTYSFAGDRWTRRDQWGGQGWIKPIPEVKLYGGYGLISRKGTMLEWFEPGLAANPLTVEYDQHRYHVGVQANSRGHMLQAEYRQSDYRDKRTSAADRRTTRYQIVSAAPVPRVRTLLVNAGFQHFEHKMEASGRKLTANTVWAGGRLFLPADYTIKYSFLFDRATNAGDRAATDNITNAAYAGKTWRQHAGLMVGYQYQMHDDIADEIRGNGYYAAGWAKPLASWTWKAEFGSQQEDVKQGVTLTGDEDRTRFGVSSSYEHRLGTLRVRYENTQRNNDDIGTSIDFQRLAGEIAMTHGIPGQLSGSYAVTFGKYETTDNGFSFRDHVLSGLWLSPIYRRLQTELEGTYYRSQRDLDVESFSLRLLGRYEVTEKYKFEISYAAHNFDDLTAYNRYYTANIVEIAIVRKL